MSSLTSLGVNKNKAKFAPKANRNKVRKRPQCEVVASAIANNEEASSKNNPISEANPETNIKPRELTPPPPPPITQIQSTKSVPAIITEAGSPSTPTPDSPTPSTHAPENSSSLNSSTQKSSATKKDTPKKKDATKKKSKKKSDAAGVSLSAPSKGTSFNAPSRSGASITVGESRSKNDDKENKEDKEAETATKKPKKRRLEDLRPEELKTLEDIDADPARLEDLDKPMTLFTKDLDGIVSKNFREMEKVRYAQKQKLEAMKSMSKEELDKLKEKEVEEEERKKQKLALEKEEQERKRKEAQDAVIEESSHALQVRIVDGEIVLDMDSLTVERGQGTANYEEGSMEVVEENAMTKKLNSRTYGKHTITKRWSKFETEEFYEALAQFGTDFEMMANILPGRTRNMVRSKFNREEKVNPERVSEYLIRKRKPMDLERYKEMTGIEFDEVPHDFHEMEIA